MGLATGFMLVNGVLVPITAYLMKRFVDTDIKAASIIGVIIWWLKDGLYLDSAYIAEQIVVRRVTRTSICLLSL